MIDNEKIDHEGTYYITCPYCGNEDIDSWEVEPGEEDLGLIECGNCDKEFYAVRSVYVSYSTEKAKYGTCKHCGEKEVVIENYKSSVGSYEDYCSPCGYRAQRKMHVEEIERLSRELEEGAQDA